MKVTDLKNLIEQTIKSEVKKRIISENNKKEVYHIKCEGIPLATYESEKEAQDALPDYKEKHKDGELIIEKGVYENHDDMIGKLDELNDQLEETDDNMENMEPNEGNAFSGALANARKHGDKEFNVGGKEFDVKEDECNECGDQYEMQEDECNECGDQYEMQEDQYDECGDFSMEELDSNLGEHNLCECGGLMNEEGVCSECGMPMEEHAQDGDPENVCPKCGKQVCECGGGMMNESKKKKTIRLTESAFKKLIDKMVTESVPGLRAAQKAHKESGKENKSALSDIEKEITKSLKFEGNDNPEFPKAIGKGEKVARKNTKEQDEEVKRNFAGLENLQYDVEPSETFKKRLKMAIEGDRSMGNAPTTEKTNIVASNGAKAKQADENKDGNTIPTPETAKKIEKQVKDREEDMNNRRLYKKEAVPVDHKNQKSINESIEENSNLSNEIKKMKDMAMYNKKTQ